VKPVFGNGASRTAPVAPPAAVAATGNREDLAALDSIWTSENPIGVSPGMDPNRRPPKPLDPGQRSRFWWFVAFSLALILAIALGFAILFWRGLSPADKETLLRIGTDNLGYLFGGLILLLAAIFAGLDGMFNIYILPLARLIEEFAILINVNPAHRVQLEGGRDIIRLAHMINAGADRFEALHRGIDDRVRQIRAQAEAEKQMLAAVLAELPQGVLLCNVEGQVMLYNRLARIYLSGEAAEGADAECYLGLGRSVFRILDQPCLDSAVKEMSEMLALHPEGDVGSALILRGAAGRRLYAQTAPIVYADGRYGGFILLLNDIERQILFEERFIGQWQRLRQRTGQMLGHLNRPGSATDCLDALRPQLLDELSALHQTLTQVPPLVDTGLWPLEPTPAAAFLWGVRHAAARQLNLKLTLENEPAGLELELDAGLMRQALLCLMGRLRDLAGVDEMTLRLVVRPPWAGLQIIWRAPPPGLQWLRHQLGQPIETPSRMLPLTIKQVFDHHRLVMEQLDTDLPEGTCGLHLDFPVLTDILPRETEIRGGAIVAPSRPEFYDFDLFHQPGISPEINDRPLTELTYTVFDTETTGLDPTRDEIISIGAVRIVNGRILYEECFDQLVDPRRPLSPDSIRVHGILPERLVGQPTIDQALPSFQRFTEETVLVGHNAAFDLRMFQVKAASTGVVFINPVLDTMLLSSVVNPSLKEHNLDAIARRLLGRSVADRHTALGDALATAEIFLKLIPLLKEMDIITFAQALAAARRTYYARLKY
jgi:DNA polymerase III subunit epsilon